MTSSGPRGRDRMPFGETMRRYHGEIERLVYAVEIRCDQSSENEAEESCDACSFRTLKGYCIKHDLRHLLGNHVEQHDIMPLVPPCACGGRCNK